MKAHATKRGEEEDTIVVVWYFGSLEVKNERERERESRERAERESAERVRECGKKMQKEPNGTQED